MKKFRKVIPALCMLLISAVLMSTSTFAWFSMNKKVTATGMQITAKSDSTYLLISSTNNTVDAIRAENEGAGNITTALTIAAEAAKVYPSAHETTSDIATLATPSNWYYEIAASADASTAASDTKTALTEADVSKYVLHKTVYLALAAGSDPAKNLRVSAAIVSNNTATGSGPKTIAPVKVVVGVVGETAIVELDSTNPSPNTVLKSSITKDDAAPVQVEIYIYYNGKDAAVYTNNFANLDGATIDLTFTVENDAE